MTHISIASMKIHSQSITHKDLFYWTAYDLFLSGWKCPGTESLSKAPWVQVTTTLEWAVRLKPSAENFKKFSKLFKKPWQLFFFFNTTD